MTNLSGDKPIRLFLVRHGNTFPPGNEIVYVGVKTDLPLTVQGQTQEEHVGQYFKSIGVRPTAIYAGALKRQIESAEIIAYALNYGHPLYLREPGLTELDYGPWEGLKVSEIQKQWPNEYNAWITQAVWPNEFGNSFHERIRDIGDWINILRNRYKNGETVIAVSSNGILRLFYTFIPKEWERLVREHKIEELKVGTGCFCELLLYPDHLEVIRWNVKP